MNILKKKNIVAAMLLSFCIFNTTATAQMFAQNLKRDSARSDKHTGGKIEKTALVRGDADIKITVNVPSFQLTLWQNGKEVKNYLVGVGLKDFPIAIGLREASDVIWNPNWIPPASDWVTGHKGVKAGEVIKPTDPRNPLGKLKIPLGGGYLIHQAKGIGDLGGLVSHGCVRMLRADLYDLAEKIVMARSLPVSRKQIELAKRTKKTLTAPLDPSVPVEITYDTQVVEAGRLHIYPDVYDYKTKTVKNLREELESSGVDSSHLNDKTLERMLAQAAAKKQFVVGTASIKSGRALTAGRTFSVLARGTEPTAPKRTNGTIRQRRASR
ncbi:MAG: L,D-transpeptidase [Pyrinomonadaceae bacterium]